MTRKYIIEEDSFIVIDELGNSVTIQTDIEGFISFVQTFWIYKPFHHDKEKKEGLQYFSHLIMDCDPVIIYGEVRIPRRCPTVDYFVIEGNFNEYKT